MDAVKCATVAIAAEDVDKVMRWAVGSKKFHQSVTVLRLGTAEVDWKRWSAILRETLRHERDKMKHVRCRDVQSKGGPQGTDRGTGRVARSKWCVKWTLQLDRRMVDLRRTTSFSFGTSLRRPMRQKSWAVSVPFQTRQHTTDGCWFLFGEPVRQSMMTRLEEAGHCAPGNAVKWNHCGLVQMTST